MTSHRTIAPPSTAGASSIVETNPATAGASSTVKTNPATAGASSIVKLPADRVETIERRRVIAGYSHAELSRRANVQERTWSRIRRSMWEPTTATLDRLEAALLDLPAKKPPQIVKAFHRHVMKELCRHLRAPLRRVMAEDLTVQRPRNANWLQAARINRMAIYIIAVELELENAELARALGCTRQNVKQARDDVFDWMDDDGKIARAIAAVSTNVTGRAE